MSERSGSGGPGRFSGLLEALPDADVEELVREGQVVLGKRRRGPLPPTSDEAEDLGEERPRTDDQFSADEPPTVPYGDEPPTAPYGEELPRDPGPDDPGPDDPGPDDPGPDDPDE